MHSEGPGGVYIVVPNKAYDFARVRVTSILAQFAYDNLQPRSDRTSTGHHECFNAYMLLADGGEDRIGIQGLERVKLDVEEL